MCSATSMSPDIAADKTAAAHETGERDSGGADPTGVEQDEKMIRSELVFTVPLLMEFPKCYWIWKYREWLLQQPITRLPAEAARSIWEEELALVGKMLHKDKRNFHAWSYRRHVVANLESSILHGTSMTESEFAYTTRMITGDLSNFSAWHNRSKLIPRLLKERRADEGARRQFLQDGKHLQPALFFRDLHFV